MRSYINTVWCRRFIEMAELVSTWSKDPSTKVGCVLVRPEGLAVISTGFNGLPRGVQDRVMKEDPDSRRGELIVTDQLIPERWEQRPDKYLWVEHAERNAVFNAARLGLSTLGAWAFMNYEPCPCTDCARALIQAGIARVVGPQDRPFPGVGNGTSYQLTPSITMLFEAGVSRMEVPM